MKNGSDIIKLDKYFVEGIHINAIKREGYDFPIHWHEYFEIEIILDGEGTHVLNDKRYEVKRGSAYLLTPTDFHSLKVKSPIKLWNISFDETVLYEKRFCELANTKTRFFQLSDKELTKLEMVAELLQGECTRESGDCKRELCECLITLLFRSEKNKNKDDIEKTDEAAYDATKDYISGIKKASLYLDMHFRESPSLAEVAKQAGFHPSYFCELFAKVTGEKYSDRLNSLRTAYAKTLLENGISVTDACYRSGFGSLSNFLYVFKQRVGIAPSKYRARAMEKSDK